jgi:hypothetical protein
MTEVKGHGISFDLPDGWSFLFTPPITRDDGVTGANFRAASMTLPLVDNDGYGAFVAEQLGALDALIILQEMLPDRIIKPGEGGYAPAKPATLTLADFSEERVQRRLPNQMGYLAMFTHANRAFQLYAVLGSGGATRQVDAINGMLASYRVGGA